MSATFLDTARITIVVPSVEAENYIRNVQDSIPSFLGHYDRVLWISDPSVEHGTEQFRPLDGSNPAQGGSGETNREPSVKMEFCLPDDEALITRLITEIFVKFHPWEEPVILVHKAKIYDHKI